MARVVMLNTVCSGSHGRIMRDLRAMAEQDGHSVTLAYGRGPDVDGDFLRIGTKRDVLFHVALTRAFDRHARGSLHATRQLVKRLQTLKPDLLHLHNVHGYYLHAETLFDYLRAENLPTIWTHHDCWAFTGHCSHYVRAGCARWQEGCHNCPLKRAYPASYGVDASKENWRWKRDAFASVPSLRIVTPSVWLAEQMSASTLRDVPIQVIGNGVDISLFRPGGGREEVRAAHGVAPGQAMLLAVASPFDARKGFADALAVAQKLKGRAKLVLVGLTAKQIAGLPEGIFGLERTDGPEALVSLYGAADCLLNPTYEDTYPTVNMEAMACGTPVACYGVGGATEQLQAPCGTPVSVGDTAALAKAAMDLAARKHELSGTCRAYAEAHFDRNTALQAYQKLYKEMLGA